MLGSGRTELLRGISQETQYIKRIRLGLDFVNIMGAVQRVPGARSVTVGPGKDWGLSLATPVIVKYRDDKTDLSTALEGWLR